MTRPAHAVDAPPSLRALYTPHCTGCSTALSATPFLRVGRPSPSNGRLPGARGMRGPSMIVTSGEAMTSPSLPTRYDDLRQNEEPLATANTVPTIDRLTSGSNTIVHSWVS